MLGGAVGGCERDFGGFVGVLFLLLRKPALMGSKPAPKTLEAGETVMKEVSSSSLTILKMSLAMRFRQTT